MSNELPKIYNSTEYEDNIYKTWLASDFFTPEKLPGKRTKSFTISLPPPNATGVLHTGHAAMLAIQDLVIRHQRMQGKLTLWLPGTDHAAIATQSVVEKNLKALGKTKYDLGREKFLEEVNKYVKKSQGAIKMQMEKMGVSCDWSRERYTLDEGLSNAVKTAFVKMYQDGLIYRGCRIVNWCPRCESTLSDDEVEYKPIKEKLYWLKYGPFILATTRPETKLGDTCVAVHPSDKRYKKHVGKKYLIPGALGEFEITVVADRVVDPKFGSGVIKVTPAHDFADFEIAQRHNIKVKQVIDKQGRMMENCGKYAGLTTRECREQIVKDMDKMGLIKKIEDYDHNLSVCYRCGTAIEPLPSEQWFVDVNKKIKSLGGKSLKQKAIEVVKSGQIKIIPAYFEKVYFHWLENLRDWCISRQLWFGHQIPVWYRSTKTQKHKNTKTQPVEIVYYVHGTTTDNEKGKASGHADVGLSKLGIKQAKDLAKFVEKEKFDAVFCSDLKRAVDSAKLAFGEKQKIIKDKRLRECDYGDLTQTDNKKLEKNEIQYINNKFPNGESYKDVADRVADFLNEISKRYEGKKIAIIAHKAPQFVMEVLLNGKSWEDAVAKDWRKVGKWQPGWKYVFSHPDEGETKSGSEEYEDQTTPSPSLPAQYQTGFGAGSKEGSAGREIYVGVEKPKGAGWTQDPDTLDTWFSSGLWTFSTLGWPAKTKDLKNFHPTSLMETGYDILFFWVARMILMSNYLMGEVPFKEVYLHGLVRDKHGDKMSKSKPETCIDPLDVIAKYGADAVRLSLLIGTAPGNDLKLTEEKIGGYRNFVNKLWNISRYILMTVNQSCRSEGDPASRDRLLVEKPPKPQTLADSWILSELNELIKNATDGLKKYQFSLVGEQIYEFTWSKLADWYVEQSKVKSEKSKVTDEMLLYVLQVLLKLWHPFTPFVTETIWKELTEPSKIRNHKSEILNLLIIQPWPKPQGAVDKKAINDFELIQKIIVAIRNIRAESKVPPAKKVDVLINAGAKQKLIADQTEIIKFLAHVENLEVKQKRGKESDPDASESDSKAPPGSAKTIIGKIAIYVKLGNIIDVSAEQNRVKREITDITQYIKGIEAKFKNKNFIEKAPKPIVEAEKEKLQTQKDMLKKLEEYLKGLK